MFRFCRPLRLAVVASTIAAIAAPLSAQDPFELEVYSGRAAPAGAWEAEARLAYSARGTTTPDGAVQPTDRAAHLTLEVTHGLGQGVEVAAYGLFARQPATSPEFAGWRLRLLGAAPATWHLPVNLGLNVELGHTAARFDEHAFAIEATPAVSHRFGRLEVRLNARFERGLGAGADAEWEFEPSARAALSVSPAVQLSMDYFSALGAFGEWTPTGAQIHQLMPGATLRLGDDIELKAGIGFGLTAAGDRTTLLTTIEIPLAGN